MSKFCFNGRPDGLGNRIEEIINLEGLLKTDNLNVNYLWNNHFKARTYSILIKSKNVNIIEKVEGDFIMFERMSYPSNFFTQEQILEIAKSIVPSFEVAFSTDEKPIGVHIRGTDRIGLDHPHFMKDNRELYEYMERALNLINIQKPRFVFVCADNIDYKNKFVEFLDKSITLVEPICDKEVPIEYKDLFALSLCNNIFMCSKFSSFSIIASLIGNIPLITFNYDKEVDIRYKAFFKYELNPTEYLGLFETKRPEGIIVKLKSLIRRF